MAKIKLNDVANAKWISGAGSATPETPKLFERKNPGHKSASTLKGATSYPRLFEVKMPAKTAR